MIKTQLVLTQSPGEEEEEEDDNSMFLNNRQAYLPVPSRPGYPICLRSSVIILAAALGCLEAHRFCEFSGNFHFCVAFFPKTISAPRVHLSFWFCCEPLRAKVILVPNPCSGCADWLMGLCLSEGMVCLQEESSAISFLQNNTQPGGH